MISIFLFLYFSSRFYNACNCNSIKASFYSKSISIFLFLVPIKHTIISLGSLKVIPLEFINKSNNSAKFSAKTSNL